MLRPGGQLSDLVETELSNAQYQEVVNLRQEKIGEWECVEGYKEVITGFTNIKAAIEITEDRSGDRFLLVQDGTSLKRVDYDIVNSPNYGYENETPTTITLPSGVTIGSSAVLRFFYFRGVVRITGASAPMWYGYINRTIFPNSWSTHTLDDFNAGVSGWAGSNATVVQETVSPLLEGAGVLDITATAADGYAYKAFTVVAGTRYKFFVKGYKASGQTSENYTVNIGTTQGGAEIATETYTVDDTWYAFELEFTPTVTTIYISFTPIDNGDIVHFDYAWLRTNHQIVIDSWYLFETALKKPTTSELVDIDVRAHGQTYNTVGFLNALAGFGLGYDESQYSLIDETFSLGDDFGGLNLYIDNVNRICSGSYSTIEFDLTLDETLNDLYRITSLILATYYAAGSGGIINPEPGDYTVQQILDITDEYEDGWIFVKANLHIDHTSWTHRINLWQVGDITQRWWDGLFQVGRRIKMVNSFGSIDSVITSYNEANSNDQNHYIETLDETDTWAAGATDLPETGIWIEKVWDYTAGTGYKMRVAIELEAAGEGSYPTVTETPSGTENNTPNFSHHAIIEERAYVASLEDEEEDAVRFSPELQFDNLPIGNLIQTQVGDIDATRAIAKRAGRLAMLKQNSISQGNFVQGNYYEDIGLHDSGLYATFGFKVIDDILYYMDREEVYAFYGQRPVPLLVNEMQRNEYRTYVNENSLIFYDKIHNEIWFVLKGLSPARIMVFHPERKEWYIRRTDITPICSFLDYDKKMLVASTDKIVTYNHSETTFDEDIQWSILTKVWLKESAEYHFKCNKVYMLVKGSEDINVTTRDAENGAAVLTSDTITPNVNWIRNARVSPKLMIRELELVIGTAAYDDLQTTIQRIEAEIEIWK